MHAAQKNKSPAAAEPGRAAATESTRSAAASATLKATPGCEVSRGLGTAMLNPTAKPAGGTPKPSAAAFAKADKPPDGLRGKRRKSSG